MNEVKTHKAQALELLALDSLTYEQIRFLNAMTFARVFNPDTMGEMDIPDYHASVDACLTLPIGLPVAGAWWNLHSDAHNLRYTRDKKCGARIMSLTDEMRAATLPLAMLKAWWSIQSEH